jgi:hypothetical protein
MPDDQIHRVSIDQLHQQEGAHELATSPDMKPYLEFIKAVIQDGDPTPELEGIRAVPLEKRYDWRVVCALKWSLVDCDDLSVDKQTLTPRISPQCWNL